MKIKQKKTFEPITVTLETEEEARSFLSIIDKIDNRHLHGGASLTVGKEEFRLVMEISNAFTHAFVWV